MKVLFLCRYFYPHIGGVEKHAGEIARELTKLGNKVSIITEKYDYNLHEKEKVNGINIIRFEYPHIKFLGLLYIWFWLFKNLSLIKESDIVHCHDVFIWYLPFRFLYPKKPVFTTIHGLEWDEPLAKLSILQKKMAARLSTKIIGVGKFLEKYLRIKFDLIIYGATEKINKTFKKTKNTIVYVGRLEENTGLLKFLEWLRKNKQYKIDFCGDGPIRSVCEKYGKVYGFTDPTPFLQRAEYSVPGGYLAALEALSFKCKIKVFWDNPLKRDYWKFFSKVSKNETWESLTDKYLSLWQRK